MEKVLESISFKLREKAIFPSSVPQEFLVKPELIPRSLFFILYSLFFILYSLFFILLTFFSFFF